MDREISKEVKQRERRKRVFKYSAFVGCVVVAIVAVVAFTQKSVEAEYLEFYTIDRGNIEISALATGVVVPVFEQVINSPISSRIMEVYCQQGTLVEAGTPILKLDLQSTETEYMKLLDEEKMKRYQLEQLKANNETALSDMEMKLQVKEMSLSRLEVEYRNERYLDSIGSGTTDKVRQAQLAFETEKLELLQMQKQYENAQKVKEADYKVKELEYQIFSKNLSQMKKTLEDAAIKAPAKGILTFVNSQLGAQIGAGSHIATLSDLSTFMVEGEISDRYLNKIETGSKIRIDLNGDAKSGRINSVNPLSQDGMVSFTVLLDNPAEKGLRSGLKGNIHILLNEMQNTLRINHKSFYVGNGDYKLYVKTNDNTLELREVKLGDSGYNYIEVMQGLEEGDEVVVSDMASFKGEKTLRIK